MKQLMIGLILLLIPFCNGCIAFYTYEKYQVKVVDAESNTPISGAQINLNYMTMAPFLNPPRKIDVMTGWDGVSFFAVADYAPSVWKIQAEGYLPVKTSGFRVPEIFKIAGKGRVVIPMYQKPEPKIEIVVPDGYRGVVALHVISSSSWIQGDVGKRCFSYRILPNGYLSIQASPLFHNLNLSSISARYENGEKLPSSSVYPNKVCFRWVGSLCDTKRLYFIGTKEEQRNLDDALWEKVPDEKGETLNRDAFNSYFRD